MVNPQYRELDSEVKKQAARLARKRCECGAIVLCDDIEPEVVVAYETNKSALWEEIEHMEVDLADQKACRKATPRHVQFADLPEEDRFRMLGMKNKHFIDTIKLIAYRAETPMANVVRKSMSRQDDARSLLRSLYATEADILPDWPSRNSRYDSINRLTAATGMRFCTISENRMQPGQFFQALTSG